MRKRSPVPEATGAPPLFGRRAMPCLRAQIRPALPALPFSVLVSTERALSETLVEPFMDSGKKRRPIPAIVRPPARRAQKANLIFEKLPKSAQGS